MTGKQQAAAAATSEKGGEAEAQSRCLSCGASPFGQMGRREEANAAPALEGRIHGITKGILARKVVLYNHLQKGYLIQ